MGATEENETRGQETLGWPSDSGPEQNRPRWDPTPDPPTVPFPGAYDSWEQWPIFPRRFFKRESLGASWEDTMAKVRRLVLDAPARGPPQFPTAERQQQVFNLWSPSGWGSDYAVLDIGAVQLLLFSTANKWKIGRQYIERHQSDHVWCHVRVRHPHVDVGWNKLLKEAIFSNQVITATMQEWAPSPLPVPVSRTFGKNGGKGKRKAARNFE